MSTSRYEALVALLSYHTKEVGPRVSSNARPWKDCMAMLVTTDRKKLFWHWPVAQEWSHLSDTELVFAFMEI